MKQWEGMSWKMQEEEEVQEVEEEVQNKGDDG